MKQDRLNNCGICYKGSEHTLPLRIPTCKVPTASRGVLANKFANSQTLIHSFAKPHPSIYPKNGEFLILATSI